MDLVSGARLGPYEILAPLGQGGMGDVYKARDTRLHRDVAIKVLPAGFASDPERRARFEREAQAVAALSHPNVLAIHDTGIHDGQMFVVTELLEGETLGERLKAGALPVRKALDAAVQIARGLAAAHDKHIIHRDLKPENVFLLRDGRVKILDFGLARHMPSTAGATETVPAATNPGVVMGTVGYMAPEQVRGQPVDARADLFAFGTVLYEMLTGQRAFRRDTVAETMTAILRDGPPELLSHARADLSPALDRIVLHCLEKDPAERFQSASDIAFALEALSGSAPVGTGEHRVGASTGDASHRRSRAMIGVAIAVVAVAAAAFIWWRSVRNNTGPDPAPITIATATQVTADDGLEIDPVLSPDGMLLAYAAGTATRMRIFIRPVAGGRTITLSEGSDAFEFQPRWSPDGSKILYLTSTGAFVASALGGTSQRVASPPIDAAAWSPDGKRILVVRGDTLSVVQLDGSRERPHGTAREPYSCSWSPNDKWIACASGNRISVVPGGGFGNIAPSAIVVLPAAGGASVDVTDRATLNQSPVWSPDGRQLYFVSNRQGPRDVYVMEIADDGRALGEPRRVSTGLGVQSIGFSGGQRLAYVTYAARANIWSLPVPARGPIDTSGARVVTTGNQIIESMRVSRDGRWLLYDSNLHLNADIFRIPVAGGAVERLTTDPADDFCPDLSPDGRELAYHSWRSGSRDIFVKKLDGGAPQQITTTPAQESYPIWSPDGSALAYFDQLREGGVIRGLFVIRRDRSGNWGTPVSLRAGAGSVVRGTNTTRGEWSPDGQFLAYPRQGSLEIADTESRATRVAYAPSGPADPRVEGVAVSEDGQTLYFKSHDAEQRASFWALPFAGGKPRLLVRFTDPLRPSIRPDFAVGAGQFFFTFEDRQADIWVADVTRR